MLTDRRSRMLNEIGRPTDRFRISTCIIYNSWFVGTRLRSLDEPSFDFKMARFLQLNGSIKENCGVTSRIQSTYLSALKLVTLFSIAFAPGISLSQLPKVTDRHLMCATILSQTPSLARYNEDFKYTWNAFSAFKNQFQKSLPMELQERVAREDSPEIFYKGDKPMNADESVRLLARLASITNQPKTLKEIIGIHLQGEQQIAEFISNLTYSYKTVELMKKTSAAERNAQHRRFAMLATIVYTGFNASLIFGDESLYL